MWLVRVVVASGYSVVSCVTPRCAYKDVNGKINLVSGSVARSRADWRGHIFELGCGRCVGCKMDTKFAWAVRLMHESKFYDCNWFGTFTYDDAKLKQPLDPSLNYHDWQLFMRRLRRDIGGDRKDGEGRKPLRFFCSGEYGGRFKRPHFHAILFNLRLRDAVKMANGRSVSEALDGVWSNGNVVLDSVTPATVAYVAGYTQKKVNGRGSDLLYEDIVNPLTGELFKRRKEFVKMSLKPGIGSAFFDQYGSDLFPHDFAIVEGKRNKVPRYYLKRLEKSAAPELLEDIKRKRMDRAREQTGKGESTPERRLVKEDLMLLRQAFYSDRSNDEQ